ncbi:PDPFL protein, partial [Scopus umbretta]|nr:PDPFL protein [Scopus umbretta]
MASVPSAGCLLAKNQYYRSKCSGGRQRPRPGRGGSSGGGRLPPPRPPPGEVAGLLPPSRKRQSLSGLPELIDKCWWIKNFFHSEPSPPTVGRKTLSAS